MVEPIHFFVPVDLPACSFCILFVFLYLVHAFLHIQTHCPNTLPKQTHHCPNMLDDSILSHPLLAPVGVDVLLANHPWNPQSNDTPVVHPLRRVGTPQPVGQSIFINGNSRVEQRTRLIGNTIEFKPYPATAADLDSMESLVGTFVTVYVLYKGVGRQGSARVAKKVDDASVYVLNLQPLPKLSWADMDDE